MFGIPKNKSASSAATQPTAEPGLGPIEVAEPNSQLESSPELVHVEVTPDQVKEKLEAMFETTPQSNDTTTATVWLSGLETGQTIDSDVLQTMLLGSMARVVQETPYTPEGHFTLTYREDDGVDTYQFSTMSELQRPFDELETLGLLCSKIRSQFELIDIHPTERWLEALTTSVAEIKDYLFNHPDTVGHMVTTIEIAPGPKRNNINSATLKVSMVMDEGDVGAHLMHLVGYNA